MDAKACALFHFLVLAILAVGVFSRRRPSMIILLFIIPVLGEIVQFFMPSRTPDFMDIVYGYLGIVLGYCLVLMWREIKPVVKKVHLPFEEESCIKASRRESSQKPRQG